MTTQRKITIAVALGAAPLLLLALEIGPDAGYVEVPGELGTCAAVGCHVGTANNPAFNGGIGVNATTYTPGVKQRLTVTVSDAAATQRAWGFQMTARNASSNATMAGTFASTDNNTTLMCASSNLRSQQEVPFSSSRPQTCPSSMVLQYIEHSLPGYNANRGKTGSATFEFDWTPPATDVGNITLFLSGNAANGDLTVNGDHIFTRRVTLTPAAAGPSPAIAANGVVNGASFQPGISPNSWFTILGTNLSSTTGTWDSAIVNGNLPTTLNGVSVSVAGKPAYVYFVSPTQVNAVAPDVGTGTVAVTVTNAGATSAAQTANSSTVHPAFFLYSGTNFAITTRHPDAALVGPASVPGTVAAKPGDVVILWGTGFGPTTPAAPFGVQIPGTATFSTANPVTVSVGSLPATVLGAAMAPTFAGLFQVAITIPDGAPTGDLPVVATVSGAQSPATSVIRIQR
jgi:uncharacterized protein (TIGR03437 family)